MGEGIRSNIVSDIKVSKRLRLVIESVWKVEKIMDLS